MRLETFFEKFDLFADAPGAVAKMRELVRNFAVKGKLVYQNPNDEPAETLVARIAARLPDKKSENPFLGKIEALITDESEYELPAGWAWLPLGHVGIWATGCGFPMQYQGKTDGEFLFCKVSDMNLPGNEIEIHTTVHSIDTDVMKKIRARANPVGTVIFPKIGGAIATHKRRLVIKPTIIDNNCSGIQPIGLTDDSWLLLFMRTLDLTKYQSGTSVPAVSQSSLDPIRIGLPPLAEQKRIVAKVDELMALCDRLEAQQQERETRHAALARASLARFADAPTPANLQYLFLPSYNISPADLRKSILTLAVQGKLVPQDPNDEPAVTFLAQIARQKQVMIEAKRVRQGKVSRPHSALEAPTQLPPGWEWVNVDSLCFKVTDGTHFTPQYASSGVRFVSAKDIVSGNLIFDRCKFITQEEHEQLYRRCNPEYHDIVISKSGSIGAVALVEDHDEFSLFESLALLKFDQTSLFPKFLVYALTHACASLTAGHIRGVGVKHLHLDILRGLEIALPPLAEQHRIVAKVDQLMALVDQLETQLETSRTTAAKLMEALVAELTALH